MSPRTRSCSVHPSYVTGYPPKTDCLTCWAAYGRRRAIDDGLRSQGKLQRKTGRGPKEKGRQVVLAVKALFHQIAPWLANDDVLVKATSMLGVDLHLSPRAAEWFPFSVECKNSEYLSIWAALRQAQEAAQASGKSPVVFFKRAGTPIYVALAAIDLLTLLPWPANRPSPLTPSAQTPESSPETRPLST